MWEIIRDANKSVKEIEEEQEQETGQLTLE